MAGAPMADPTDREYEHALMVLQSLFSGKSQLAVLGPVCAEYHFFAVFPALEVAFDSVYGFFKEFRELPTTTVLAHDLRQEGIKKGLNDLHIQSLTVQAQEWLGRRIVNDGPAERILRAFREEAIRLRLRENLDTDHLQQAVDSAVNAIHADPFRKVMEENPFSDPEFYLSSARMFPFGPPFIDIAMGGGALLGETVGLVAPSGGGKTTIALQIAERQVYEHQHVILVATEQKMKGDLAMRSFVLGTDMTRSDWTGNWKDISPKARERFDKVRDVWLKYFHFYDISRLELTSIDALYAPVRDQIEKGNQPVFFIIDWWGDVRDALIGGLSGQQVSEAEIRRRARGWLKEVVNKATEYQIVNFILHQLKGSAAGKSAAHINSSHDAQEDSNFNNRMDFAFTLSKKGPNNSVSCHIDKARRFRNNVLRLRLDGEHCRFHLQGDPDAAEGEMIDNVNDTTVEDNYRPPKKEGFD